MKARLATLLLAVIVAGCVSTRGRAEVIAFTPPDGTWTMSALMLVTGNTCGVGYVKSTLVNRGPMPIGGSYRVTVADQFTFSVLGEFVTHCQIAAPNSSATCSDSRQSFSFPCRPISVLAVPVR